MVTECEYVLLLNIIYNFLGSQNVSILFEDFKIYCMCLEAFENRADSKFYVKDKILVFEILPDYSPLKIDVYV
jgi:hypothetical protein